MSSIILPPPPPLENKCVKVEDTINQQNTSVAKYFWIPCLLCWYIEYSCPAKEGDCCRTLCCSCKCRCNDCDCGSGTTVIVVEEKHSSNEDSDDCCCCLSLF